MLSIAGWRVMMATLFTQSFPSPRGFALACQLDKGLGPDVDYMALRREEDCAAASVLGIEPRHVPLPEAPHRGYHSAAALFGPILPGDDVGPRVAEVVEALLADLAPDLVLAPQAIGAHVDHVQLVRALDGLSVPALWWHDFPYTVRQPNPPQPFPARFADLPLQTITLDAAAVAAKSAACAAYASQLGFQFGGAANLAARLADVGATEAFRGAMPLALTA